MSNHFEDLWESAEKTLQEDTDVSDSASILKEIYSKLTVYTALDSNASMSQEDRSRLKIHIFGKILLTITQLSYKDNVDVYKALKSALDEARISQLEEKYK